MFGLDFLFSERVAERVWPQFGAEALRKLTSLRKELAPKLGDIARVSTVAEYIKQIMAKKNEAVEKNAPNFNAISSISHQQ